MSKAIVVKRGDLHKRLNELVKDLQPGETIDLRVIAPDEPADGAPDGAPDFVILINWNS